MILQQHLLMSWLCSTTYLSLRHSRQRDGCSLRTLRGVWKSVQALNGASGRRKDLRDVRYYIWGRLGARPGRLSQVGKGWTLSLCKLTHGDGKTCIISLPPKRKSNRNCASCAVWICCWQWGGLFLFQLHFQSLGKILEWNFLIRKVAQRTVQY